MIRIDLSRGVAILRGVAVLRFGGLTLLLFLGTAFQATVAAGESKLLWSRIIGYPYPQAISVSSNGEYMAVLEWVINYSGWSVVSPVWNNRLSLLDRRGRVLWNHLSDLIQKPLTVSPNGSYVSVGYGSGVALFDRGGNLLWNVTLWKTRIFAISTAENGKCQVVAETGSVFPFERYLLQLDARGRMLQNNTLRKPLEWTRTASISDKGDYVAVATGGSAGSYQVHLFTREGQNLWSQNPGGGSVDTVFVTSNGSYVAAGSGENEVYLYGRGGELRWTRKVGGPVTKVSVSPDGKYVLAGSRDGYLYCFGLGGELLRKRQFAEQYGSSPSFTDDGVYLAVGVADYNITLFDMDGRQLWSRKISGIGGSPPGWVPSISYKAEYTAWFSYRDIVFIDRRGEILWQRSVDASISGLLISSAGDHVAARSDNKVYLFDRDGKHLWTFESPSSVCAISISIDGAYVAIGSDRLCLLDNGGKLLWTYETNGTVRELSPFSSDGNFFALASMGNFVTKVYLFSKDGKSSWGHEYNVISQAVSLSADGNYVVVGSNNGLYLYNREGGLLWNRDIGAVDSAFSTVDGSYIAAVAWNTTYRGGMILYYFDRHGKLLWRKENVKPPFSFSADEGYVLAGGSVFGKEGSVVRNSIADRAYISSDGGHVAMATKGGRLIFMRMQDEDVTPSALGRGGLSATALALGFVALPPSFKRLRQRKQSSTAIKIVVGTAY